MELFRRKDYLTKEGRADVAFSEAYRGMTDEIERVSREEVTIWARLTSWIYSIIFRDAGHVKELQDSEEKHISAKAFKKMKNIFEPVEDDSFDNEGIMNHAQRKFKK